MVSRYKIADQVAEVSSIYDAVHEDCADYRTDEPADYSVSVTQVDIDFERQKSDRELEIEGTLQIHFSDAYLEGLAVYRKIAEKMIDYNTMLFHGSVVAVDGVGYLFTAKSGTGKSTHTRLWRTYFVERAVMVNDDKPLLKITDNGVIAYGTPYNGKHRLGTNISVPLKAVCILTRAAENSIVPITREQAYAMLVQQAYRPADSTKMLKTMSLIDLLAEQVGLYRLGCNMDKSAAKVAYEGMR